MQLAGGLCPSFHFGPTRLNVSDVATKPCPNLRNPLYWTSFRMRAFMSYVKRRTYPGLLLDGFASASWPPVPCVLTVGPSCLPLPLPQDLWTWDRFALVERPIYFSAARTVNSSDDDGGGPPTVSWRLPAGGRSQPLLSLVTLFYKATSLAVCCGLSGPAAKSIQLD